VPTQSRTLLGFVLGHPWWTAVGVILATLMAIITIVLGVGGSPSYSYNGGNCNAQGNHNVVKCH